MKDESPRMKQHVSLSSRLVIVTCLAAVLSLADLGLWFRLESDRRTWDKEEADLLAQSKAAIAHAQTIREQITQLNDRAEQLAGRVEPLNPRVEEAPVEDPPVSKP